MRRGFVTDWINSQSLPAAVLIPCEARVGLIERVDVDTIQYFPPNAAPECSTEEGFRDRQFYRIEVCIVVVFMQVRFASKCY